MKAESDQISKILLAILTLIGLGIVVLIAAPNASSTIPMDKATFTLSGNPVEPVVFIFLFAVTVGLAIKANSKWAILCGLPFLALAVLPFFQTDQKPIDFERLQTQLTEQKEAIAGLTSAFGVAASSLATLQSTAIKQCRICFQQTYRKSGSQCRGAQLTCSGWTSAAKNGSWTKEFVDDTDKRSGPCIYQWALECR